MEKNLTKHQVVLLCTFSIVTHKPDQITPLPSHLVTLSLPDGLVWLLTSLTAYHPVFFAVPFPAHAELRDEKFSLADPSHTMKSKEKH